MFGNIFYSCQTILLGQFVSHVPKKQLHSVSSCSLMNLLKDLRHTDLNHTFKEHTQKVTQRPIQYISPASKL